MLPTFMPVATQAAIKGLTPQQMESLGVTLILNNTYHLNLRPGVDILNAAGGAHKFQGWNKNLLTVCIKVVNQGTWGDFSLIHCNTGQWRVPTRIPQQIHDHHRGGSVVPQSVYWRAHHADCEFHVFTHEPVLSRCKPEESMNIQHAIGADIIMQLDDVGEGVHSPPPRPSS